MKSVLRITMAALAVALTAACASPPPQEARHAPQALTGTSMSMVGEPLAVAIQRLGPPTGDMLQTRRHPSEDDPSFRGRASWRVVIWASVNSQAVYNSVDGTVNGRPFNVTYNTGRRTYGACVLQVAADDAGTIFYAKATDPRPGQDSAACVALARQLQ